MSTGHKWVFSDGRDFRSQLQALLHLKNNPTLTVVFSELTMGGTRETDVTANFKRILNNNPYRDTR